MAGSAQNAATASGIANKATMAAAGCIRTFGVVRPQINAQNPLLSRPTFSVHSSI
jgi:hypothetical protein